MTADLILCFDIGTTSVKAGVIGLDGQPLALSNRTRLTGRCGSSMRLPGLWPQGWHHGSRLSD